ncbi:hypothetical protein [Spirosoma sp. KUDC1026]|uniref:hypothetical protein n=1 Tax=Spirosoma sp. KUDC1026 TaxID=2745947 RepID=UPI00159BB3AC|nr:hypothetical protein [Spirosoma sp. KUDC1026]QKZ14194.1 hypothetical protein HU175_16790 [Spirosoma sp. KUDC1026]
METILGVGFDIPSDEEDYMQFDTNGSLSDADIIIFNPDYDNTNYRLGYGNSSSFRGKSLYDDDSSFEIQEHAAHWKNEITIALKAGKTIFIT